MGFDSSHKKSLDWYRKTIKDKYKLNLYYENSKQNHNTIDTDHNNSKVLVKALKKLPKNQQIVLSLFYFQECSIVEIGKILKMKKGTVKSRLFYAREKLKLTLKQKK
jgi:RNA polymerase sigma-70 factor (ECF subfamily)